MVALDWIFRRWKQNNKVWNYLCKQWDNPNALVEMNVDWVHLSTGYQLQVSILFRLGKCHLQKHLIYWSTLIHHLILQESIQSSPWCTWTSTDKIRRVTKTMWHPPSAIPKREIRTVSGHGVKWPNNTCSSQQELGRSSIRVFSWKQWQQKHCNVFTGMKGNCIVLFSKHSAIKKSLCHAIKINKVCRSLSSSAVCENYSIRGSLCLKYLVWEC